MRRHFREDKNHMNHQPDADSKENRLTCHPVGRPLSAVGFTNTKTQPGANAPLRDNDLLSRPRTSNHKKNQKQSPASPVCPASPDLRVGLPDNHLQNLPLSPASGGIFDLIPRRLKSATTKRPDERTLPSGHRGREVYHVRNRRLEWRISSLRAKNVYETYALYIFPIHSELFLSLYISTKPSDFGA